MGFEDKGKKKSKFVLMSFLVIPIVLFGLRGLCAVSLFEGLNEGMQSTGWISAGDDSMMQVKEELTYEASYLLFKIGAVRFQVLNKVVYDGVPAYRLRAYIDSYSGIPFVDLHAVYETYADARSFMCLFASNSNKDGDSWVYTSFHFDFAKKQVDLQKSRDGKIVQEVTFPIDHPYTDGVSFFYYLREYCRSVENRKTQVSIPIIVDTVRSSVDLTVNEKYEGCEVTAFDFPISANRMSGHINFKGFYGITGDFVGWMSADSAEVPLRGNVEVILGSVVVKLKAVKRADWNPPRSAN